MANCGGENRSLNRATFVHIPAKRDHVRRNLPRLVDMARSSSQVCNSPSRSLRVSGSSCAGDGRAFDDLFAQRINPLPFAPRPNRARPHRRNSVAIRRAYRAIVRYPRRAAAAGLFNSCASPADSVPSDAIFSFWRNIASVLRKRPITVRKIDSVAVGRVSMS